MENKQAHEEPQGLSEHEQEVEQDQAREMVRELPDGQVAAPSHEEPQGFSEHEQEVEQDQAREMVRELPDGQVATP
jgi:hypothetical protein